ncbi:hypothetical protein PI95_000165 [Hassallia byssoidea VB512170]|uniref:P pilus assembly/Cpx signaling pathway, periplasmic inhibitor/zinc-resistance associated protein n=1 Tax=Hassallia byssoidea VB512170 TaxID=1304833 RepID=A0A846H385_9CYAN|nr:hypothetical protein [Hassalia byssoidea]NEU71029.1 hypothetical protein [Hassalia byssoidea VB512170]
MKFKNLSLIAGAIALSLTAVPFSVKAETTKSAPIQLAQNPPAKPPAERGIQIQLTPQQQTEFRKIDNGIRDQVQKVMTPQQLQQIKTAMESGKSGREAFAAVNFSPEQQAQLQKIFITSQQQKEALLTADQKAQLARFRQQNGNGTSGSKK